MPPTSILLVFPLDAGNKIGVYFEYVKQRLTAEIKLSIWDVYEK